MIQTILSLGAIILLSIASLSMNRGFDANDAVMRNSKYAVMATSVASSIIEEATSKAFDETTSDSLITTLSGLTVPGKIGLDAGESYSTMNDFDDYNGYTRLDTIDAGGALNKIVFSTTCSVCYVNPSSPDLAQYTQTWYKKIIIRVSSPAMTDTIRQDFVFSYFRFQ
jgi:hypothetical protein